MRTSTLLLSLMLCSSAWAENKPDFSGPWELADPKKQPSIAATGDAEFITGNMGSGHARR